METGFVRFFNRMKGWGFIVPDDFGDDVFVHYTGLVGRKYLREGQHVGYELGERAGKPLARNVEVIEDVPLGMCRPLRQTDALALLGSPKIGGA
jgi:cold shock protein